MAAARTAAARGKGKQHEDRVQAKLTAMVRLRVNEAVLERVARRALQRSQA